MCSATVVVKLVICSARAEQHVHQWRNIPVRYMGHRIHYRVVGSRGLPLSHWVPSKSCRSQVHCSEWKMHQ